MSALFSVCFLTWAGFALLRVCMACVPFSAGRMIHKVCAAFMKNTWQRCQWRAAFMKDTWQRCQWREGHLAALPVEGRPAGTELAAGNSHTVISKADSTQRLPCQCCCRCCCQCRPPERPLLCGASSWRSVPTTPIADPWSLAASMSCPPPSSSRRGEEEEDGTQQLRQQRAEQQECVTEQQRQLPATAAECEQLRARMQAL